MSKEDLLSAHYWLFAQYFNDRMMQQVYYRMMHETATLIGSSICFLQSFNH